LNDFQQRVFDNAFVRAEVLGREAFIDDPIGRWRIGLSVNK
jgi:hypothetical protein